MLPRSNHEYPLRPCKSTSRRRPITREFEGKHIRLDILISIGSDGVTPTLPVEVVLEIIDHVKEDHDFSSLYAYSLVSLDWLRAMRSTLFTEMTVTFSTLSQFICLLASPCCSLTHHVRELCICQTVPAWYVESISGDKSFNGYAGRISNIMQLLPNVTRLNLQDFDFPSLCRQFHHETYAGFDQIETLVLRDGMCEALPFALEEVLSSFPRVRTLECDVLSLLDVKTYLFSRGLALQHPSAQYLPELTELSLMGSQVDLVTLITRCVSLQNIKILNYDWGSDLPEEEVEAVFTILRLIGPTLQCLSFTGCMDGSMNWQNGWESFV